MVEGVGGVGVVVVGGGVASFADESAELVEVDGFGVDAELVAGWVGAEVGVVVGSVLVVRMRRMPETAFWTILRAVGVGCRSTWR